MKSVHKQSQKVSWMPMWARPRNLTFTLTFVGAIASFLSENVTGSSRFSQDSPLLSLNIPCPQNASVLGKPGLVTLGMRGQHLSSSEMFSTSNLDNRLGSCHPGWPWGFNCSNWGTKMFASTPRQWLWECKGWNEFKGDSDRANRNQRLTQMAWEVREKGKCQEWFSVSGLWGRVDIHRVHQERE